MPFIDDHRLLPFSFAWDDENTVTLNISAFNLHSDPMWGKVKYTHNSTQIVKIQWPVSLWTTDCDDYWIVEDGGIIFN